jgi:hypothetical protein
VNPSTEGVTADESYDPEDEKNNGDCPKHFVLLDDCRFLFPRFAVMVFKDSGPSCGKLRGASGGLPRRRIKCGSRTNQRGIWIESSDSR